MSQHSSVVSLLGFLSLAADCGSDHIAGGTGGAFGTGGASGTMSTGGASTAAGSTGTSNGGGTPATTDGGISSGATADASDPSATWSSATSGTAQDLYRVWGSGPTDVWVVGAGGVILRWNGSAWSGVTSGTGQDLHGLWGSGPSDVWAVGFAGTIVHWNGSAWSATTSNPPLSSNLYGVWGSGPDDVWAVGDERAILHWNGFAWSAAGLPTPRVETAYAGFTGVTTQIFSGVWGSGPSDVWVVGSPSCKSQEISQVCADDSVLHWNGSDWSLASSSNDPFSQLADLWGSGPGDYWAVGWVLVERNPVAQDAGQCFRSTVPPCGQDNTEAILHSAGSAWVIASTAGIGEAIWGSGPRDVWAVSSGILHWNGFDWSAVWPAVTSGLPPPFSLYGVWGTGPGDIWAVGRGGTILHRGP